MEASDLVANVLREATGETSNSVSGDDTWKKILGIANVLIDDWSREPDVDWNSLYDPAVNIGVISATDTYDLDSSIRTVSNQNGDFIRIIDANDSTKYYDYTTVPANLLKKYTDGKYCAQIGSTLKFNKVFTSSDDEFGGSINVPAYLFPDHLVNDSDIVPVDDPNWLVHSTAAEYVRNDLTLAQNYPLLLQKANLSMQGMKEANSPQVSQYTKGVAALGATW